MLALSDVNVLLALSVPSHHHAPQALEWLNERSDGSVAICRQTQSGLLRLLSEPKIMGQRALTMGQAWNLYDRLMSDSRFVYRAEPDGIEALWRKLCPPSQVAPRLWTDAYLASFAAVNGMQLVTFDRGFRRFAGVNALVLGQEPALHEEEPQYTAGH
jgi:toxin-antitoxin system PIN domain toxin